MCVLLTGYAAYRRTRVCFSYDFRLKFAQLYVLFVAGSMPKRMTGEAARCLPRFILRRLRLRFAPLSGHID